MPVKGITGEALGAHHQALFVRDRQAEYGTKLITIARFALADALHLWRMQRVEFIFGMPRLGADTISSFQQVGEFAERTWRA